MRREWLIGMKATTRIIRRLSSSSARCPIERFQLERYFAEFEFSAPFQLCNSDCEAVSQKELLSMADEECLDLWNGLTLAYTETRGHPKLLQAIAEHYDSNVTSASIATLAPEEGIYSAMRVLIRPGDTIICTTPGYQSLYSIAKALGAHVVPWNVRETNDTFWFDSRELQEIAQECKPTMIVTNFPHNPTGALPSQDEWRHVGEIADTCGATLFSDEMYRMLEFDSADRLPSACEISENAITLCGLSKSWGAPGLRVGWLASQNVKFLEEIAAFRDYTTICSAAPAEILGVIALRNTNELTSKNVNRVRQNLKRVRSWFAENDTTVSMREPKAGPIMFPKMLTSSNIETYTRKLVRDHGILLLPSTVYDYGDSHFRLGLGRDNFDNVFQRWIESFSKC